MKNIKITNRKTRKSYFIDQKEHDQMKEAGLISRFKVEFNAEVKPAPGFRPKEIRNLMQERFPEQKEVKPEEKEAQNRVKLSDEDKPVV